VAMLQAAVPLSDDALLADLAQSNRGVPAVCFYLTPASHAREPSFVALEQPEIDLGTNLIHIETMLVRK
jgi:hypothetical protein